MYFFIIIIIITNNYSSAAIGETRFYIQDYFSVSSYQ